LGCISALKKKYGVPVGFIDHTPLVWMPAAAVAAGADFVTKHLALSREEKGPDWQVCLEPEEMKEAVLLAKNMKESIATVTKQLAPGENFDRSLMRRSVVAAAAIVAGKTIKREDLVFKRPGSGLDPSCYTAVVGKVAKRNILADEQINYSDLREELG
jgi:N-acetylneuraminate synthase